MSIFDYIKYIGKRALLVGLAGTVIGCSSISYLSKPKLRLKPTIQKVKDTKKNEKSLDGLVNLSLVYQTAPEKVLHEKTWFDLESSMDSFTGFHDLSNSLINLTETEKNEVKGVLNSIQVNTYHEFLEKLSQLNEKQITLALSGLAGVCNSSILYSEDNSFIKSRLDSEIIYNNIREFFSATSNIHSDKDIMCGHIHNFVSETARKAGLPEAIVFLADTKETPHAASALWWPDGDIKIIDSRDLFFGKNDLEDLLQMYQMNEGIPTFSHSIYRKKYHIFTFTTTDGEIFYKSINYPHNTDQLKDILTNNQDLEKATLKAKAGNTENSVSYSKNNLFTKIGYLRGSGKFPWNGGIIQGGLEKKSNLGFYNLNLLISDIENKISVGIMGNVILGKKFSIGSDDLSVASQVAFIGDYPEYLSRFILNNGVCYTTSFDSDKKIDLYTLLMTELIINNVLTQQFKIVFSEIKSGCKFSSGNIFINPEYIHQDKADILSLETGCNYGNLDLGFTLSTSNTRYKRIWPDEKSLELSTRYTSTNDLSIGGSIKHSQKKWPLDEKYDTKVKFWLEKRF